MVALFHSRGLLSAGVGAGIGFGKAESANPFAAGQFRQIFLLLGLCAVFKNGSAAQRRVSRQDNARCGAHTAQLFNGHGVKHVVGSGTAILFGYGYAHQAQFGHLFYCLHRKAFLVVNFGGQWLNFLFGKFPNHLQKQVLPFCGVEIHIL